jgi:hypothetical protein
MTTIKKQFEPLADAIATADISEEIKSHLLSFCYAKTTDTTTLYHDGELVAVYCYYHKQWERLTDHSYGVKKGTNTGLNTMCKVGVNQWTKQQSEASKSKTELLTDVATGRVSPTDLTSRLNEIENHRQRIDYPTNYVGYSTREEVLATL